MSDSNLARDPERFETEVRRIVSEVLGKKAHRVTRIRKGVMTFKFMVEVHGSEQFIVRFYPENRASVVNCEPDLIQRCYRAGLLVPQVLADSRTDLRAKLSYVVYRMIDGTTLSSQLSRLDSAQTDILAAQLAQCIFKMGRISFVGHGELTSSTSAGEASWDDFIRSSVKYGLEAIRRHALLDDATLQTLASVLDRLQHPLPEERQLVWGDISFDNVLVDSSGRLAALVDFESCLSGDPLATLGYCLAANGNVPFFSSLLEAWPEKLTSKQEDRIRCYSLVRVLRLAPYAHLPLPTGYPRDSLIRIFPGMTLALTRLVERLAAT